MSATTSTDVDATDETGTPVWLLWTGAYEDTTLRGIYGSRDAALRALAEMALNDERPEHPRITADRLHGAATHEQMAEAYDRDVDLVIAAWRGLTQTGRNKIATASSTLAAALDRLAFPMIADMPGGY